ncbi:MAG: sodium/alanine symporter [Opitutae bacterium]|nr:sodium/alanine symporter [Opitutae bacterium]
MSELLEQAAGWLWGAPLLVLLLGGGTIFMLYSRFVPFLYLRHGVEVLLGKYDDERAPGEVSHFRALCSALSGTVGMGNVAGVAIAVTQGGPGALFWMWVCALVGMATKFFTCSLAIMYRGKDDTGQVQGGPMYFIVEGLGPKWKPLAVMFCACGLFGCLPLLQSNQLTEIVRTMFFEPNEWFVDTQDAVNLGNGLFGALLAALVGLVIFGGIKRIGRVAGWLVPSMVLLYGGCALIILGNHWEAVPAALALIFTDAFSGEAVAGGALGTVIMTGVRRAAFSNEAGMGTEAMAHGAAKTREPIREGVVAMLGPMIDTLVVCTITGLVILVTGVWQGGGDDGVSLTASAFAQGIPGAGSYLLLVCVLCLSFSSMIGFSYYVTKCGCFLLGSMARVPLILFYLAAIVVSSVVSMDDVINFLDLTFGLMAIPTILSSLLLAPKVMAAAREYFESVE